MYIAIYSAFYNLESLKYIRDVIEYLDKAQHRITIVDRLKKHLAEELYQKHEFFNSNAPLDSEVNFLFSVGGDGTLLRSITVVRDTEIPILGINTGRLGFLTSLQKESLFKGLDMLFNGQYKLIKRSLLDVTTDVNVDALEDVGFALNEITINRKNTTSMLSIETALDERPLTTYWADGLIVATPTGSTGYSLSSGGPILSPETQSWVLNPIAPHNINIRPLIVPDSTHIKIAVTGRGSHFLLSLDSRIITLENGNNVYLKKAHFSIFTIQLDGDFFFKTLRERLFWGQDTRNIQ